MTKNRIIYAAVILCLFLFYVYCNSYIALYVLELVLGVTFAGAVLAFFASRELSVELSKAAQAFDRKSRKAEFCASVKNGSSLPIPIMGFTAEIRDASEKGVISRSFRTSVAASDRRRIYISVTAPYAALIEAAIKKVYVCDGFGVIRFPVKSKNVQTSMLVTPSSQCEANNCKPSRRSVPDSDVYSDTQKGDDRSQVFELREYREGDDLRNVHWGLSSKHDSLIVKEFSKPLEETCTVVIESSLCTKGDPEITKQRTDKVLAGFISLMTQLIAEGQPTEVCFYSSVGSRLCAFEVKKYEDTASVMKAFLSGTLPEESFSSLNSFTKLRGDDSSFYYIYDSTSGDSGTIHLPDCASVIDVSDRHAPAGSSVGLYS